MTATQIKPKLTFLEFLENLPDEEGYYELVNGEIMRKLPTRRYEDIADFIQRKIDREVERLNLNYRVSCRFVIATETEDGREQGRHPDVTIVDKTIWESQPMAYSALLDPPQLVVEVVSTNWEDDYIDKLAEYQRSGIAEYWIVDHSAIGSRSYLGNPKQPTIFIFSLDEKGSYSKSIWVVNKQISSGKGFSLRGIHDSISFAISNAGISRKRSPHFPNFSRTQFNPLGSV